jgi:hypothetical protein
MASGVIHGSTGNQYIDAKIEWSSTPNIEANKSSVKASLYYKRNNIGYTTSGTGTFSITINGEKTGVTKTLNITEHGWVLAVEATATVTHNSDGSKAIGISATGDIPGTSLSSTNVVGTVNLDTIPRASDISSAANKSLGEACSIRWTPMSASFRYKLKFSLGDWSDTTGAIHPNTTSAYTYTDYTLPLDVANQLPNAKTGAMTVTLYTYSDSGATKQIGSESSKTFTVTVPENEKTKPTVSSMSLSPSSNLSSPYNDLYIQGHSRVKATLDFSTEYGATVSASNITVNGKSYASPYESDILSQAGKVSVKATVKDSRGYYGTNYKEIEVIPYRKPYVTVKSDETSIVCARCDASANFTDSGTYLKIKAKIAYSKVISNGVQNNYGFIKFRYRKEGGAYSSWNTILDCKANNSDEVITPPLLNGALDIKSNYQVQIIASDDFYDSAPITFAITSDAVYMDRPAGGKSMGLGGYSTGDGRLDVYWKTIARGGLSLFDAKGDEIPLDTTMPIPRDQVKGEWNPDNLECGIHVVANNNALKTSDGTVIMYNGVLIQMPGSVDGSVKLQLALPVDENRNPMYRLCWYSNWSSWRSMKL